MLSGPQQDTQVRVLEQWRPPRVRYYTTTREESILLGILAQMSCSRGMRAQSYVVATFEKTNRRASLHSPRCSLAALWVQQADVVGEGVTALCVLAVDL
mmetsp:Transcript_7337/g.8787  ORF Transcript_7337/g.8787 Transcript_7337/m.8787 type:complete len:99 (-) Transcript_7337:323-619(-)